MENITHSLVGATLAELALPAGATTSQRRVFFAAGILAANLPDADLLYSRITPPPLGYLLHHRGHTHTLGGVAAQLLLLGALGLIPAVRERVGAAGGRLWALLAIGLTSHLVLDSWNSYGVHPLWPFDARWFYGDVVFIVEPWIWVFLGVAATLNARGDRGRLVVGAGLATVTAALAWFGMISLPAAATLGAAAALLALLVRGWPPRMRTAAGLSVTALFVASMFAVRQRVEERVLASMPPMERAGVVDVVLNPHAANPLCWTALAITADEPSGEYAMTRATATAAGLVGCGAGRRAPVEWATPLRRSLTLLRDRSRRDCRVRAWMRFGRAPLLDSGMIGDLRFGGAAQGNFTAMPLAPAGTAGASCPRYVAPWGMPRADLLRATAER